MKICTCFIVILCQISADSEEKILSRKKRIDEVNEDYDQKADDAETKAEGKGILYTFIKYIH